MGCLASKEAAPASQPSAAKSTPPAPDASKRSATAQQTAKATAGSPAAIKPAAAAGAVVAATTSQKAPSAAGRSPTSSQHPASQRGQQANAAQGGGSTGTHMQRSPNSSGHSRGQDSGRSGGGGNRSGRHNEPVPPPPQQQQQQQDSGRPKEKNNGYVVRPPGSEPLDGHRRYTKIREINSGASGFVQLAHDGSTGEEVAIKFVPRGSPYLHRAAEREILNHRLLAGHAHIVQFREVFLTEGYLGIVMEYVNGGDMADLVDTWNARNRRRRPPPGTVPAGTQCLPEAQARRLFQQLIVAVDFLHHLGIANRDIKLENALLQGDPDSNTVQLKLCDFGYSKDELSESLCKTLCGTPEYIAPEVLIDNRYQGKISDIWSAGVLLYVLLTGVFPFWRKEDEKLDSMTRLNRMFPRIVKAEYELPAHVSAPCRDLLSRMLSVDTKRRLSVAGILRHPWFRTELSPTLISLNHDLLDLPTARRIICPQSEAEIRELIHIAAGAAKTSSRSASGGASRSGASAQAATPGQKQHTGAAPPGGVASGTSAASGGAGAAAGGMNGGTYATLGQSVRHNALPPTPPGKQPSGGRRPLQAASGSGDIIMQTSDSILGLVDLVDQVMDNPSGSSFSPGSSVTGRGGSGVSVGSPPRRTASSGRSGTPPPGSALPLQGQPPLAAAGRA